MTEDRLVEASLLDAMGYHGLESAQQALRRVAAAPPGLAAQVPPAEVELEQPTAKL